MKMSNLMHVMIFIKKCEKGKKTCILNHRDYIFWGNKDEEIITKVDNLLYI